MKKVVLLLLVVIFCYTAFAAGDPVSAKVVNVSSSLNIREQPSKQSSVVGKIGRGEIVQVQTSSMDGWIQVQYGDVTGYVRDSYIQLIDNDESEKNSSSFSFSGLWDSVQESEAWDIIKGIGIVILIILGICVVAILIAGLTVLVGILLYVLGCGLGGGFAGILIGMFINGPGDATVNCGIWGFWIGCGLGVLIGLLSPLKAATSGIGNFGSSFGSSSKTPSVSSSDSNYTSSEPDPYYDTIIEGAGAFGGDVKGKRHWNGDIEGENGKWYESGLNDTVTEKK